MNFKKNKIKIVPLLNLVIHFKICNSIKFLVIKLYHLLSFYLDIEACFTCLKSSLPTTKVFVK